ncbi:MAG: low molecular weight phosphatase family protein [Myxococcota bacterium]
MGPSSYELLFICTGNYYRSRFAECYLRREAARLRLPWRAASRGLDIDQPQNVGPMSKYALAALRALDVDPEPLRAPLQLHEADLQRATRVVVVDREEHRPMMAQQFGAWLDRVEYWQIEDIDRATPDDALVRLRAELDVLIEGLAPMKAAGS